jgi:hypothetical protein
MPPKKVSKITMKIDIMGAYLNFQLSLGGIMVLNGLKTFEIKIPT